MNIEFNVHRVLNVTKAAHAMHLISCREGDMYLSQSAL